MIDYYLQYQPEEIEEYVKKFDFRYTDLQDEELVVLIDMLIDAADEYSQHKFEVVKVRQNFHVTLKANSELKKQRPSKVPLHLKDKLLEKLLGQLQEAEIIRRNGRRWRIRFPFCKFDHSNAQSRLRKISNWCPLLELYNRSNKLLLAIGTHTDDYDSN